MRFWWSKVTVTWIKNSFSKCVTLFFTSYFTTWKQIKGKHANWWKQLCISISPLICLSLWYNCGQTRIKLPGRLTSAQFFCLVVVMTPMMSTFLQISPLRPQRPRSQVLNQIGGDRRLSVSPGPPSSSSNSSSSPGPPPITPRSKLSFSTLHAVSSKSELILQHTQAHMTAKISCLWTGARPSLPPPGCVFPLASLLPHAALHVMMLLYCICDVSHTSWNGHANYSCQHLQIHL